MSDILKPTKKKKADLWSEPEQMKLVEVIKENSKIKPAEIKKNYFLDTDKSTAQISSKIKTKGFKQLLNNSNSEINTEEEEIVDEEIVDLYLKKEQKEKNLDLKMTNDTNDNILKESKAPKSTTHFIIKKSTDFFCFWNSSANSSVNFKTDKRLKKLIRSVEYFPPSVSKELDSKIEESDTLQLGSIKFQDYIHLPDDILIESGEILSSKYYEGLKFKISDERFKTYDGRKHLKRTIEGDIKLEVAIKEEDKTINETKVKTEEISNNKNFTT
jgi:hypothetical protein